MLQRFVIAGLVSVTLLAGCRRESETNREEFSGAMKADDGKSYIPVNVPDRKGDAILGAITANAEQQPKTEEKEAAEEVHIDATSAQALGDSIVHMATANDWKRLPEVLAVEQAEGLQPLTDTLIPFMTAAGEFRKAAAEKFAAHAIVLPVQEPWLVQLTNLANELTVTAEEAGDTDAKLIFTAGPADAADAHKIELAAKKVEDVWHVLLTDFQAPADPAALGLEKKAGDLEDLATRVRDGGVADADAAKAELDKVGAGTYERAAPPKEGGEQEQENAEQTEAQK